MRFIKLADWCGRVESIPDSANKIDPRLSVNDELYKVARLDLDQFSSTFSALFSAAQKIAAAQIKVVGAEGVNWLQNSGAAAGQEILHFHIHLIPRMVDDDIGWNWKPLPYKIPEERDRLANQLNENLK